MRKFAALLTITAGFVLGAGCVAGVDEAGEPEESIDNVVSTPDEGAQAGASATLDGSVTLAVSRTAGGLHAANSSVPAAALYRAYRPTHAHFSRRRRA